MQARGDTGVVREHSASRGGRGVARLRKQKPLRAHVLLSEKESRLQRSIKWRRVFIAAGLLAALFGAFLLYRSPLLRIQEIEVVGAQNLDPQEIAALADLGGRSIFNLPMRQAEERVATLPLIRGVDAQRLFPNKARIIVLERLPWGYWQSGDQMYVIDEEGVVLDGFLPPEGAPGILEASARDPLDIGQAVETESVSLARRLVEQVPARFGLAVTYLEFNAASGLTLRTNAGYTVVFGDSRDVEFKLAAWQSLEEKLGREAMGGHVLDLRFGDRPSFR